MRRRDFIKAIAGSAAVWPLAARAQQPAVPLVGLLSASTLQADGRSLVRLREQSIKQGG
jgi:putative tryptophan/tyrosine transport system substrate-binding protein